MSNFSKESLIGLSMGLSVLINSSPGFASENNFIEESETKKNIVRVVDRQLDPARAFIHPGGKGMCQVKLPQGLETYEERLKYLDSCTIRDPMLMEDYLFEYPAKDKTMIVGSGLFQTMLQPIIMHQFKDSFYVDTDKELYPDIVAECGFKFAYRDEVCLFHGCFDAIYFDDFSPMCSYEILGTAHLMLKPGGKLFLTYRAGDGAIELSNEERAKYESFYPDFTDKTQSMDKQSQEYFDCFQNYEGKKFKFKCDKICSALFKAGFTVEKNGDLKQLRENFKLWDYLKGLPKPLRANGCPHIHIEAYKQ